MKKKIIILGASRYYIKSIEAARKAGYYIIAVDRNPGSEGFKIADHYYVCDIIDKKGILKIAIENNISGIVPINDYGVPTASYVSTRMGLPGISEEAAQLATNKELMRKRWIRDGVPCPKVEVANSKDEIKTAIEKVGLPCILKPAHGIGGASRGVVVIQKKAEIENSIDFSQKFYKDKATLVETFVEAEYEHSVEALIYNGKVYIIAISDKIKTPLPYRVDKNVLYPTVLNGKRLEQLKNVVENAILSLEIKIGAAHVELATIKEGFYLFELGARCGGGGTPEPIVPFVTGIEEFVEQVRILAGDHPHNLIPTKNMACNYHFITFMPGTIKSIKNIDFIKQIEGVLDAELFIKEGQIIPPVSIGTERSGFIIIGDSDRNKTLQMGSKLEKQIVVEYE